MNRREPDPMVELGDRCAKLDTALQHIKQWCEAYPVTVFKPLTDDDMLRARNAVEAKGLDFGAIHASWARHLLDGIAKIAREALDE